MGTRRLPGKAAGALTILFARLIKGEQWLYSLGLMTLPGFYAFFALHTEIKQRV